MSEQVLYEARGNEVWVVHQFDPPQLFVTVHPTKSIYPVEEVARRMAWMFNENSEMEYTGE